MGPIITFASILLALVVLGLALGLLALGLGLVLRLIGIVLKLVFGVIAIALGGVFDLIAATLSLIPMCFHAGVALALVVFGQWARAERRAMLVSRRFNGIGHRIGEAFWGRPRRIVRNAISPQPAVTVAVAVKRSAPDGAATAAANRPPIAGVAPLSVRATPGGGAAAVPQAERTVGMLTHLLAFAGLAIPLGNVLGPLVVWLARKDRMPFVDDQGRESVNFNLTAAFAIGLGFAAMPMLVGFVIVPVVFVTWFVLTVVAAVSAHSGNRFRYPLSIRFIGPPPEATADGVVAPPASAPRPVAPPPTSVRAGAFPGYEVVGSLPSGGSGARLLVAAPAADVRRRLPAGIDRVVIKTFALSEGSTLPQIVRESRSMEAATRLGLVLEHHLEGNRFWYAMPYFPGSHFSEAVRSLHRMGEETGLDDTSLRRVLEWTTGLSGTLESYHAAGLWHKDVKPENVLVHGGEAKLVDIGLVTSLASGMTLTTHGTEYFRDPEMVRLALRGVKVHEVDGAKFDVYGVGAMLYLGLEDTFPAHGGLSGFSKRSPECVRWVVRRAMAEYSKRYPSMAELRRDLEFILAAEDPFAVKPAMLPSFQQRRDGVDAPAADQREPGATPEFAQAAIDTAPIPAAGVVAAAGSPRTRPSPWGLTSPGAARGAGRMLAVLVLLAVGLVASLVFASVWLGLARTPSVASIVVLGPEGDLSNISEQSALFATIAERLRREHGMDEVRLVPADRDLQARVRGVAARTTPSTRLRGQGIDGAVLYEPDTSIASIVSRDPSSRSWFPAELFGAESWEVETVPLSEVMPVEPGRRVLLLRDPTATAEISGEEIALWRTLGVDVVEPDAADAAELAVMLAGDRTGPEVQARVNAALAEYQATEFRRFREAPAIAPKPISTAVVEPEAVRHAVVEVHRVEAAARRAAEARMDLERRRVTIGPVGISIN